MNRADSLIFTSRATSIDPAPPVMLLVDLESSVNWVCTIPQDRQNVATLASWVYHTSEHDHETDVSIETPADVINWLRESIHEGFATPGGDKVVRWFTNRMKS